MSDLSIESNDDVICGMWKFGPRVQVSDLVTLALKWKNTRPQSYLDVYVRPGNKGQTCLGFKYRLHTESREDFHERITDELKHLFGNGFVGWDHSAPTWILVDPSQTPEARQAQRMEFVAIGMIRVLRKNLVLTSNNQLKAPKEKKRVCGPIVRAEVEQRFGYTLSDEQLEDAFDASILGI